MIKVLIVKNWDHPDIMQQSPESKGIWKGIQFTADNTGVFDYVLSLNLINKPLKVHAPLENIWRINQEPPNEFFKASHWAHTVFRRVFTTDPSLTGDRFVISQPAIPWFISKSYDFLKKETDVQKKYNLSCITSLKNNFLGHRRRLSFIDSVRKSQPFDLIATTDYYLRQNKNITLKEARENLKRDGFNKVVSGKWEGLAPYRYSLVIENFRGPNYWSEKLADCILAGTMPIYYGCTNIEDYFPKECLIKIDIEKAASVSMIKNILNSNVWMKNREALKTAKRLILEKYQFFPYFTEQISYWEKKNFNKHRTKEDVILPKEETLFLKGRMVLTARIAKAKKIFSGFKN